MLSLFNFLSNVVVMEILCLNTAATLADRYKERWSLISFSFVFEKIAIHVYGKYGTKVYMNDNINAPPGQVVSSSNVYAT